MDWDNKLVMKLGLPDLVEILVKLKTKAFPAKLFHKIDNGPSSTLEVSEGNKAGTYRWFVSKDGSSMPIFLDAKDMYLISVLLENAISVTQAWVPVAKPRNA